MTYGLNKLKSLVLQKQSDKVELSIEIICFTCMYSVLTEVSNVRLSGFHLFQFILLNETESAYLPYLGPNATTHLYYEI